jgi:outer membrane protein TolC
MPLALLLAGGLAAALIQGGQALSLTEAAATAVRNHPAVRSAELGVDIASSRINDAHTGKLPSIRISEIVTRGNNPVFVFGSLLEQSRFRPENFELSSLNNPASLTNWRTSLTVDLPVLDQRKTAGRVAQAGIAWNEADLQRTLVEQSVRLGVVRDYFALVTAKAALAVTSDAVTMAEADVKRTRDRHAAGLAVLSDVLAAELQLAEFKQQRIQAEGNVRTATAALNVSMGSSSGAQYDLTSALIPRSFVVATQSQLMARAFEHRPESLQALSRIESADELVKERRGEYSPGVSIFGNVASSSRAFTSGSSDYAAGISVNFDLLNPGRAARLDQARIERKRVEAAREHILNEIQLEVIRALENYVVAEHQLEVAEAALSLAVEGLRITQDRYEEGLTTITDLLRAQTALVRARMNALSSRSNQYVGYAGLLFATGDLNGVDAFAP